MPGLDGEKMSKSYNNIIALREEPGVVESKIRTMQTDPARVRLTDPGEPGNCPVFALHPSLFKSRGIGLVHDRVSYGGHWLH